MFKRVLFILSTFLFLTACTGGIVVSDPSVSVGGGDVNTAIDHVYGVSGGSEITSQSGLTIESRITPYPSFNNTNNLTLRSPLIHSAE